MRTTSSFQVDVLMLPEALAAWMACLKRSLYASVVESSRNHRKQSYNNCASGGKGKGRIERGGVEGRGVGEGEVRREGRGGGVELGGGRRRNTLPKSMGLQPIP